MTDRAKAAARVARVRAQLAELAEWRHLKAEQTLRDVAEARADLERFAAETQPAGVLARAVIGQTARLARQHTIAEEARARSLAATQQAQRELKVADTVAGRLARDARELQERRALEQLIERFAGGSSLP